MTNLQFFFFSYYSPNPQHFGGTHCKPLIDECANKSLNTCSKNAICIDTMDSYKCQCKDGFIDHDELRNPGRICEEGIMIHCYTYESILKEDELLTEKRMNF